MTIAAELDDAKITELEAKLDPEMRFRPLLPAAGWIVAVLLFGLSCFHYYTAGFGLLQETLHRGIHIACVLGLIFLVFSWNRKGNATPPKAGLLSPLGISIIDWLCAIGAVVTSLYVPYVFHDLQFRVGNPDPIDWIMGTIMIAGAARGDAPQRRLAAADHRDRAHGLCALRPVAAGNSRASRQHVEKRRQPPLSHEPGHLRHRARRRRDLRLPLRAVRRSGDARRARSLLYRSGHRPDRPLLRRTREGLDLRVGPVRHDLGLVDREHRHGRLAHHPGDDPRRLCAALCRRRRGGGRNRRTDHAADHGRGRVPDGRVSRRPLSDDHRGGDRAGVHAFLRRILPDSLRGQEVRPARPAALGTAGRARGHSPRLADGHAARRAAACPVLRLHALSRGVLGHHGLHRPRPHQSQPRRRNRLRRGDRALHPASDSDRVGEASCRSSARRSPYRRGTS